MASKQIESPTSKLNRSEAGGKILRNYLVFSGPSVESFQIVSKPIKSPKSKQNPVSITRTIVDLTADRPEVELDATKSTKSIIVRKQNMLSNFPQELVIEILGFLFKKDIITVSRTSQYLHLVATSSSLRVWKWLVVPSITDVAKFQHITATNYSKATHLCINMEKIPSRPDVAACIPETVEFAYLAGIVGFSDILAAWNVLARPLQLTQLVLQYCVGPIGRYVQGLSYLVSLFVARSLVTDECLTNLPTVCPLLQDLIMFETNFFCIPKEFEGRAYSKRIERMMFNSKRTERMTFTNTGVQAILAGYASSLRRLELGGSSCHIHSRCNEFVGYVFVIESRHDYSRYNEGMFVGLTNVVNLCLREVCLGHLTGFGAAAFASLVTYAPNLETLIILDSAPRIDSLILNLKRLSHLKVLKLDSSYVVPADLAPLAAAVPAIEYISLALDKDRFPASEADEHAKTFVSMVLSSCSSASRSTDSITAEFRYRSWGRARKCCKLSWFDNIMQSDSMGYRVSDCIPINSLRDIDHYCHDDFFCQTAEDGMDWDFESFSMYHS
jgi:hypothetical protein